MELYGASQGTSLADAEVLKKWSGGLLLEIFGDEDSEHKPVTSILIDDVILSRAAGRAGIPTPDGARTAFLSAFPDRGTMLGWFGGSRNPGTASVAFLVLCCYAASESAELDDNDYRRRLAELLGWQDQVVDCKELPVLWHRLQRAIARKPDLRPLILPPPLHRTQIGHAIELTFPSRPDVAKIRRVLECHDIDSSRPAEVISFLRRYVLDGWFTSSFRFAYSAFEDAWRSGCRAVADDRFWQGWKLIVGDLGPSSPAAFTIVADEWNRFAAVGETDRPIDFDVAVRRRLLARDLAHLIESRAPIFLVETNWGRWSWSGNGVAGKKSARAALIFDRSYRTSRLEQFDRQPVRGAPGWSFTTCIEILLTNDERAAPSDEEIFDPVVGGVARIDGGYLCRPTFPLTVKSGTPLGRIEALGDWPEQVSLDVEEPVHPLVRVTTPVTLNLKASIASRQGRDSVVRTLRLRATAVAPAFADPPARLTAEETWSPPTWNPVCDTSPASGQSVSFRPYLTLAAIDDLIEVLACRTSAIGLADFLELVRRALGGAEILSWDVLQAFQDAGIVRLLRNVGWQGRSVMACAPKAVLRKGEQDWTMIFEGVVHDALRSRVLGAAQQEGLAAFMNGGATIWSPPTLFVVAPSSAELLGLARRLEIPSAYWNDDITELATLRVVTPNADGRNHSVQHKMPLSVKCMPVGMELWLREREPGDAPAVWELRVPGQLGRTWSTRNCALLDAHFQSNEPAFELMDHEMSARRHGARLPLPAARWLRLCSGVAPGPSVDGTYNYEVPPRAASHLRAYLGPLLSEPKKIGRFRVELVQRAFTHGRVMARARAEESETLEPWRLARQLGRN